MNIAQRNQGNVVNQEDYRLKVAKGRGQGGPGMTSLVIVTRSGRRIPITEELMKRTQPVNYNLFTKRKVYQPGHTLYDPDVKHDQRKYKYSIQQRQWMAQQYEAKNIQAIQDRFRCANLTVAKRLGVGSQRWCRVYDVPY